MPVYLSLSILTRDPLKLLEKTSSKLLAKVNLEKGLYSKDKIVCFLNGNIPDSNISDCMKKNSGTECKNYNICKKQFLDYFAGR